MSTFEDIRAVRPVGVREHDSRTALAIVADQRVTFVGCSTE